MSDRADQPTMNSTTALPTLDRPTLEVVLAKLRENEREWDIVDEMGSRAAGNAVQIVEELLNGR